MTPVPPGCVPFYEGSGPWPPCTAVNDEGERCSHSTHDPDVPHRFPAAEDRARVEEWDRRMWDSSEAIANFHRDFAGGEP